EDGPRLRARGYRQLHISVEGGHPGVGPESRLGDPYLRLHVDVRLSSGEDRMRPRINHVVDVSRLHAVLPCLALTSEAERVPVVHSRAYHHSYPPRLLNRS